ncbi:MAG: hypothetical protein OJF47_000855 [Nitrospira sp.]|nr:MAG: hypothetical protein OJF47_000855 [Nitrospira sp.]
MIPALTQEVRTIRQTLEEREREDLFGMKRFKCRQSTVSSQQSTAHEFAPM